MFCKNQRTYADKHQNSRQNHTVAVVFQHLLAVSILVEQSFGDKNRVVIALTEDECRQNDVDDVEFYRT